ncbi:MAG TPA: N-acetylneuraminate synthase family protein, partial [Elusimicrobiales bacterium]|nr:N-acetylneuraminate synthase family protein [Elusimicrobiales bacterium]
MSTVRRLDIGGRSIGPGRPALIVAELSANHNLDFNVAVKTLKAMKAAGADAVKIQTYTPDTITIDCKASCFRIRHGTLWDGQTLYDLYKKAYTPWDWQPKLRRLAERLGLVFFSSPFDRTAVDFLERLGVSSPNAAVFFPSEGQGEPPSGAAVAGLLARTDAQLGPWRAPVGLGTALAGAGSLAGCDLSSDESGDDRAHVAARRTSLFLEESLRR